MFPNAKNRQGRTSVCNVANIFKLPMIVWSIFGPFCVLDSAKLFFRGQNDDSDTRNRIFMMVGVRYMEVRTPKR